MLWATSILAVPYVLSVKPRERLRRLAALARSGTLHIRIRDRLFGALLSLARFTRQVPVAVRSGNLDIAIRNGFRFGRPVRLYRYPVPGLGDWSVRRINMLAALVPGNGRYLEIGVSHGNTFAHIRMPIRIGVEPRPHFDTARLPKGCQIFVGTSDAYFASRGDHEQFGICFIDGDHTFEQTYRDLVNAFRACPEGIVLVDDIVPHDDVSAFRSMTESYAERSRRGLPGKPWHGDVFRLVLCLADHHPELEWRTIVGSGNEQLVVWRRYAGANVKPVPEGVLSSVSERSYESVFADGIPEIFHATDESTALAQAAQVVERNQQIAALNRG